MTFLPHSTSVTLAILSLATVPSLHADSNGVESKSVEEILVSASRIKTSYFQVGSSVSVLTADQIATQGHATLVDILRNQPGISVTRNGGMGTVSALRIRGEQGYRTRVIVDGVDMSDTSGPQVSARIEHLLASNIERIEILRGPQGMMYGADAGGVILITTRQASASFSGGLSAEMGRYGTHLYAGHLNSSRERWQWGVAISDLSSDGFNARTTDTSNDRDGYSNRSIHSQLAYTPSDDIQITLRGQHIDANTGFDQCGFPSTNDCATEFTRNSIQLKSELAYETSTHSLTASLSSFDSNNYQNRTFDFASDGKVKQLEYVGSWSASDNYRLLYGVDWRNDQIGGTYNASRDRNQTGVYLEWQGNIDAFAYNLGVRNDDNNDFGNHHSVRATASYLIDTNIGNLKLKSSYSTGFRAPSMYEVSYNSGPWAYGVAASTRLKEETSRGLDMGLILFNDSGSNLEITWFDQEIDDEIYFDLAGFSGYLQGSGLSTSSGVEIASTWQFANDFALSGNYTYTDSHDFEGNQRRRVPTHVYNLGFSGKTLKGKLQLSAQMRWIEDVSDGAVQLNNYSVLNLNARYLVSEAVTFNLRVENALDERYQEVDTYLTSRAAIYAGVGLSF